LRPDQEQAKRHKTRDYRYAYRGYHSESGICRVRVFEQTGKVPIIIVTELPENTNTSITNMCKYLACEIIRAHFPERFEEEEPVLWIEHYERDPAERDAVGLEYSLVEFESWTPRPQWLGGGSGFALVSQAGSMWSVTSSSSWWAASMSSLCGMGKGKLGNAQEDRHWGSCLLHHYCRPARLWWDYRGGRTITITIYRAYQLSAAAKPITVDVTLTIPAGEQPARPNRCEGRRSGGRRHDQGRNQRWGSADSSDHRGGYTGDQRSAKAGDVLWAGGNC
jgi:hypothetical protein